MAAIHIYIGGLQLEGTALVATGSCWVEPDGNGITWSTPITWGASSTTINNTCRDAAIAAANDAGYTISPADRQVVYAGALGV